MSSTSIQLQAITIAAVNVEAMVHFYNVEAVIKAAVDAGGRQVGDVSQSANQRVDSIADPDGNTIELVESS